MSQAEYDRLNPPSLDVIERDGKLYEEILYDEKWMCIGYVPAPSSRLGWFVHHVVHGLAMRYPILKVLAYALRHTDPEWPDDPTYKEET